MEVDPGGSPGLLHRQTQVEKSAGSFGIDGRAGGVSAVRASVEYAVSEIAGDAERAVDRFGGSVGVAGITGFRRATGSVGVGSCRSGDFSGAVAGGGASQVATRDA